MAQSPKVIVAGFSVSADGFGAGVEQSLEQPLGLRGGELHQWMYGTKFFHDMIGKEGGAENTDHDFALRAMSGFGAFIMGRNMFGPERGEWTDSDWQGWWGENPPYHAPTFILTHHPRPDIEMQGGTTFHFVTDGIASALDSAKRAASDKNIKIAGGVSTARQYIEAGLVDEIHFAISPVLLGQGEAMFAGLDLPALGYQIRETVPTEKAMHLILAK